MNVLIVTQYFWPENFKITDLALELKNRGHDVTVLTGKPNYPEGRFYHGYSTFKKRLEYYNGIKIIRSILIPRRNASGLFLFLNYFSFAFFASIASIFRINKKQDVIFVYEPSPITIGIPAIINKLLSGAPIFFWVQDLWPESISAAGNIKSKFILNVIEKLVKFIYRMSNVIFISSKSFRRSILEKGVPDSKIAYLPNWAEDIFLTKIPRDEKISALMPSDGFRVVFAGNIGDAQDFESIINAVEFTKPIRNIHWIIIGDGRKKSWVEKQKAERKLDNIHLLGKFPIEKMPIFFSAADVLLVSLKNDLIYSMTVPAKVQAYLACGKPLLAMINGDGAEIVRESKAGFAVNAGDYKDLSEKVMEMYKMPKSELNNMGICAREYYENNFERKKIIEFIEQCFKSYACK